MNKHPAQPPELRDVLPLAMKAAFYKATELAKQTKTSIAVWKDNKVVEIHYYEIDAFLEEIKNNQNSSSL